MIQDVENSAAESNWSELARARAQADVEGRSSHTKQRLFT